MIWIVNKIECAWKNPFIKRVKFLVVKKYFSEFGWEHAQFTVVSTLSNGPDKKEGTKRNEHVRMGEQARMAQFWEHWPFTNMAMARVRILASTPYVR